MMDTEYSHLVIGYLEGRLNEQETDQFFTWLESDALNKQLYFELKAIHDSLHHYPQVAKGTQSSWEQVSSSRKKHNYARAMRGFATHAVAGFAAALMIVAYIHLNPQPELTTKHYGSNGLEADVVELSDGSKVTLGPKSTISYSSEYGRQERVVHLQGEAYFEVAKEKNKPFKVMVEGQEIKALGTHFNVSAYPKDSLLVTTLLEGVVQLSTGTRKTLLNPDQQLIFNKNRQTVTIKQVDADKTTYWTTGYYHFHEQNLTSILGRMGNVYGVDFEVQSSKISNKLFTGTFYRGQDIEDILQIIQLSVPIKWKREGGKYRIIE